MKGSGIQALMWIGAPLIVVGVFALTFIIVASPQGLPRRLWSRYVVYFDAKLGGMYEWRITGTRIAQLQVAAIFACFSLYVLVQLPAWYLFVGAAVVGPAWYVERMRKERVAAIEAQIDGFLTTLANALKATPSLGDAFRSTSDLVPNPLREEIARTIKEMRLGATLDEVLLLMGGRVGSRQLDTALSAILIGRQVGGNLPKVLEATANSLREMARLEGVIRTKTAEGKMQTWVLAGFPLFFIFAVNAINPGYFDPLTQSLTGYLFTGIGVAFWAGALIVARKILAVDI